MCYHGISLADEHQWSDLYLSPQQLDQRLLALRKLGATVLPLQQALELLREKALPPQAVALTFDDGAYDFSALAHPLLEAHEVPSTLYLTTYYVEKQLPVFNPLASYLMWKGRGRTIELPMGLGRQLLPESARDERHVALHSELRRVTQALDADEKHSVARVLADRVGVDFDAICAQRLFSLMRPAEIQALNAERVSIQLHTHRHRVPQEHAAFLRELSDNREVIARILGDSSLREHFCYPSGEFHSQFLPWLATAQVKYATTCAPGIANATDHPLVLPRFIDTTGVSPSTFEAWVSGLGSVVARNRQPRIQRLDV